MRVSYCKGCHARIIWCNVSGTPVPVNEHPETSGNLVVVETPDGVIGTAVTAANAADYADRPLRYRSHRETCAAMGRPLPAP